MEDIESSKEAGFSTSAGTRLFKISIVRVGFGTGVEVKVGTEVGAGVWRVDVDSGSSDTDVRGGGVSNLTTGLAYGRGRLLNGALRTRNRRRGETHVSRFSSSCSPTLTIIVLTSSLMFINIPC